MPDFEPTTDSSNQSEKRSPLHLKDTDQTLPRDSNGFPSGKRKQQDSFAPAKKKTVACDKRLNNNSEGRVNRRVDAMPIVGPVDARRKLNFVERRGEEPAPVLPAAVKTVARENSLPLALKGNVELECEKVQSSFQPIEVPIHPYRIDSQDSQENVPRVLIDFPISNGGDAQEAFIGEELNIDLTPAQAADLGLNDLIFEVQPELDLEDGNAENLSHVEDPLREGSPEQPQVPPKKSNTSRKRERNESEWKQTKAKSALDKGIEHLNIKGKLIRARKMGDGCAESCRFQCRKRLSNEDRTRHFKDFWKLASHIRQLDHIKGLIKILPPTVHKSDRNQKLHTIKYFFPIKGEDIFVCKDMFLNTLDISESWVRTIIRKQSDGHTISPDKRGKHSKIPLAVQKKREENVMQHIRMFKPVPSHFCRAKSKRTYLDPSLNRRRMHKYYVEWMAREKSEEKPVSEKVYRKIFDTKFNIGFFKPKKDQCDQCAVYNASNQAQKARLEQSQKTHNDNKILSRAKKEAQKAYAKENPATTCYAIFDLQRVLEVPKLGVGSVYYSRRFALYNFTVYDGIRHKGYCYMWNESEGKRGANEIASCLLNFIEMMVTSHGVKEFLFWSDNCSGQNKNKYLFSMYMFACAKFKIQIKHNYLERGHTQNEADSIHACIEHASRSQEIFTPEDWISIVRTAKQEGHSYEVILMAENVLDFHPLADSYQKWDRPEAKWSKVRELLVDSNEGRVLVKHDHSSEDYVSVKTTRRGRNINLKNFVFNKAYAGPLLLKAAKLKDLANLCNSLVIPSNKHAFYTSLRNFPDLTNPLLLLHADEDSDEDAIDDADILWNDENDEVDFEDELLRLRAAGREDSGGE